MSNKHVRRIFLHLLTVLMVVTAGLAFAAGEPLLHNSDNVGTKYGTWGVTGGTYGKFDCTTCHVKGASNIKRVVDTIPASIGPNVNKTVVFNNLTAFGDDSVGHTTSVRICEVCHTQTTSHQYNTNNAPQSGSLIHANGDCTGCHSHSDGFKKPTAHAMPLYATSAGHPGCASGIGCHANTNAAAAYPAVPAGTAPDCRSCHAKADPTTANIGCGSCHGAANGTGEPTGTVHPDAAGSHAKHTGLAACTSCHDVGGTGGNADHGQGNRGANPAIVNLATGMTWNGTNSTCATASCHDNGKGTPATTPAWGTSVPACTACHALIPADNSHNKHVTTTTYKKALCGDCHTGYVQGTTAAANHLNTTVEVNVGGYTSPKAKGSAVSSCATSYCHSSGQSANGLSATPVYATTAPTWGGTAACGSCHATDTLATGSHTKHFSGITPSTNCGNCHTGATLAAYAATTHVDGSIDVGTGAYTAAGAPGNGYGTCSTASCHDNGTGTAVTTPQWGNAATACAACHAASPATGSHSRHLSTTLRQGTLSISCGDCHDGAVAGSNAGTQHLDGTVDMISGSGYPTNITKHAAGSYTGSCSTVYCHSNGSTAARTITYKSISWGAAQLDCEGCHPTSGLTAGHAAHISTLLTERKSSLSYSTYSANASTGSIYKFGCANCHPVTTVSHLNGSVDVDMATTAGSGTLKGKNPVTASYDMANTKKCANVYCHSNGYATNLVYAQSPVWTGTFSGDKCAGCHGNSPDTTIAGSPAHKVHEVGIHYANIFNGVKGRLPLSGASTVNSAHGNNRATVISCNICHNLTITDARNASNPTCATTNCHGSGGIQTAATIANSAKHVNGNVDVAFAPVVVKSKAQLRDSSFALYTAGTNGWSRSRGYKNYTSSLDIAKSALSGTYTPGSDCTNVCHNSLPIKWVAPTGECDRCHSKL